MRRLQKARVKIYEEEAVAPRFVSGIPKGERWLRVQVSEEMPQKDIETLAEENRLSYKKQEDGYVLVYGKDEDIKSFIKRMSKKLRIRRTP